MNKFDFKKIEKIIHYSFKNKELLKTAFTHSSYANEKKIDSNERLEFLGDAVLNLAIAEDLYKNYQAQEGQMSKWRAKIVNTESLSNIIDSLELDKFLLVGKSFTSSDLSRSMKEDLFESLVGAIYTDTSFDKAKRFIFRFINTKKRVKKKIVDYKSDLQEYAQRHKGSNLVYFTYENPKEPGMFCAEVYINDIFIARSESESKKQAQINCAKLALNDKKILDEIFRT